MKLLLDTRLLIWSADDVSRLPNAAALLIDDEENELLFSAASIWEIVVKRGRGRPDFQIDPVSFRRGLVDVGFQEIGVLSEHAIAVAHLPPLHGDPFDRLLLAQAIVEGATLVTVDRQVARYPGPILGL